MWEQQCYPSRWHLLCPEHLQWEGCTYLFPHSCGLSPVPWQSSLVETYDHHIYCRYFKGIWYRPHGTIWSKNLMFFMGPESKDHLTDSLTKKFESLNLPSITEKSRSNFLVAVVSLWEWYKTNFLVTAGTIGNLPYRVAITMPMRVPGSTGCIGRQPCLSTNFISSLRTFDEVGCSRAVLITYQLKVLSKSAEVLIKICLKAYMLM